MKSDYDIGDDIFVEYSDDVVVYGNENGDDVVVDGNEDGDHNFFEEYRC